MLQYVHILKRMLGNSTTSMCPGSFVCWLIRIVGIASFLIPAASSKVPPPRISFQFAKPLMAISRFAWALLRLLALLALCTPTLPRSVLLQNRVEEIVGDTYGLFQLGASPLRKRTCSCSCSEARSPLPCPPRCTVTPVMSWMCFTFCPFSPIKRPLSPKEGSGLSMSKKILCVCSPSPCTCEEAVSKGLPWLLPFPPLSLFDLPLVRPWPFSQFHSSLLSFQSSFPSLLPLDPLAC